MVNPGADSHEASGLLPIPTYEEAISRPFPAQVERSHQQSSHNERQGLLSQRDPPRGYRAPTVESNRSSLDPEAFSSNADGDSSVDELRREVEQMEFHDPASERTHSLAGGLLSKHITTLTNTLSILHLPQLPTWFPTTTQLRRHVPAFKMNWILFGRLFALVLVLTLAYLLFLSNLFRVGRTGAGRNWIEPDALRSFFIDHVDASQIEEQLRYLASFPHIAGTDGAKVQTRYVKALFEKALEDVTLETYDVYMDYAKREAISRKAAIVQPAGLAFTAKLEEAEIYPNDAQKSNTPVYHGYSRSGTAQGPLVYANRGMSEDFRALKEKGVDVLGSITLIRNEGEDPGSQVHAAELAGSAGCIIVADIGDSNKTNGRYVSEDAIQRGSVAPRAFILGDPLSPGFASDDTEPHRESIEASPALTKIPSMPIAWRDFEVFLQALDGHGFQPDEDWISSAMTPNRPIWTGDSSSPVAEIKNDLEKSQQSSIVNIIGKIPGVEQREKSIIVGNHRDAWCFGAGSPNGATAVMLEIIRLFGELRSIGWRPLRTIEFASWDGGAYNLIGSTEHVESNIENIRRDAFAYINVAGGPTGRHFYASSSPLLEHVLLHTLERVSDLAENRTLRSKFADEGGHIKPLSARGDYAAFQMLGGCSSLDFGFEAKGYPRDTCYDSFELMTENGDPGFQYHSQAAKILALLILDLADREALPFDLEAYADAVHSELTSLEKRTNLEQYLDYSRLHTAAQELAANAKDFHQWSQVWSNTVLGAAGGFESKTMAAKRISHNTRMANFESNLLDLSSGLPSREQYKHTFMAPSRQDAFQTSFFPYIRDAVEDKNWTLAQEQIESTAATLLYAAKKLLH